MVIKFLSLFIVCCVLFGFGNCRYNNALRFRRIQTHNHKELEYYKRSQEEFTIKIMVHIDKVLTQKLYKEFRQKTKRKIKILVKEYIEDVEKMYKNVTTNQRIRFKLLSTKFLKNNTSIVTTDENASYYLKSYCNWQSQKKNNNWFYSILLTGLDLYYLDGRGQKVTKSTGRSYASGICSIKNSCALIEWRPQSVAYLMAHEIAHSLGVLHDGRPYNNCNAKGHIMGSKYKAKGQIKTWSSCSRMALKKYLASEKARCLRPNYVNNFTTK